MAKTSYIEIPAGTEDKFLKSLKSGDRFTFSKVVRNDTLLSAKHKKGISAKSLLPLCSGIWQSFTDAQRLAWTNAGGMMGLKGWQLFVQDQVIRVLNNLPGSVTPVLTHQSWVGKILLGGTATEIQIAQYHPSSYFIIHKVYGKKGMYTPLQINEGFGLPLQIGLSYKSNLFAVGADPYAKFYAKIINSYQGKDDNYLLEIPLTFSSNWGSTTATLPVLRGTIIGYTLFFHLHDLQGSLYFDNIKAIHNGQNWVRDPGCKNIAQSFTHQFQQIPKHWVANILPNGAEFDSVYEDF
jgi:hypothetical protein